MCEIVYFPKFDGALQIEEAAHVHKTVAYCKVVCCYSHQQEFHSGMNNRSHTVPENLKFIKTHMFLR